MLAKRDGFTSTFGVLLATLGSAVGLGNIWKFPSLTGLNGGAGFLLVYLLATLLVALPVMIVTGREDVASIDDAFEAGATSFLCKPVNWRLVAHHVKFMIRAHRAMRREAGR